MELIVDANILFASLIKNSTTAALLTRDDLLLFTPEFVLAEFRKHETEILSKTKRNSEDFRNFLRILESRIQLIAKEDVLKFIPKAKEICPDPDDVPYFACALAKNCPIWSNDKRLKEQSEVLIINTSELLSQLE